jgi:hypothetical protein
MKNTLWNVADTIVKRIATAIKTDPKEAKSFLEEISKEYWFDYLEEELDKPPTLRPMSELPEVNEWVNVLIQHNDDLFWGDGCICLNRIELRYLGQDCWKNKNYISEEKVKALGWLPKEVLPNPNEIKLPC